MQGQLQKMHSRLDSPVHFDFVLDDQRIALNPLIGELITLRHSGKIHCVHCKRSINKSFNQGYCYPCFVSLAQCDLCVLKPETCHYEAGTCREPAWGESFCFQPHIVYLANSSGIKVGITRQTQIPTRWIDQGAIQALPVYKVRSRFIAGLIEVIFAKFVSDKTSWQKMLKNHGETLDLTAKRDELVFQCKEEIAEITQRFGQEAIEYLPGEPIVDIHFPVHAYPVKINSFNFDKSPDVSGVLHGIKGQYLLLDTGVINIRKFTGYEVAFSM